MKAKGETAGHKVVMITTSLCVINTFHLDLFLYFLTEHTKVYYRINFQLFRGSDIDIRVRSVF